MLRKLLLPAFAAAALAGCATDYAYRGGHGGDYYYGQPGVDYRYHDPYGYYGFGSYAPGYYYDRFGRLMWGYPYGHYGSPYGYGSWWYRSRHDGRDHDHDHDHDGDHQGGDRNDRLPPWRNPGALRPPRPDADGGLRPRARQDAPSRPALPQQRARPDSVSQPPRMRRSDAGGTRMQRVIRAGKTARPSADE